MAQQKDQIEQDAIAAEWGLALDADAATACTVYSSSTIHTARQSALPADNGLPAGAEYFGGAAQLLEHGALQKYAEVAVRELEDRIAEADAALYEAKRAGRNRISLSRAPATA